jgi:hypothetical protein
MSRVIRLLDSRSSNCKAIVGPSTCGNALYCGEDVSVPTNYCPEHRALYFQQPNARADLRWMRRVLTAPSSRDGRRV